jgi:hypothetical protein
MGPDDGQLQTLAVTSVSDSVRYSDGQNRKISASYSRAVGGGENLPIEGSDSRERVRILYFLGWP